MDGGDPWHSCPRARGAHPAGKVGRRPWGPAWLPRPHAVRHGEEEKQRRERLWWLTVGVHMAARQGGVEVSGGLRWAERPRGPAGQAGREVGGVPSDFSRVG
jgi:hypothetical protein